MNIVHMTNTYLPHVGGVARSVESFARAFRRLGHQVLIVAPAFEGEPAGDAEGEVVRMPAIVRFNGSDFSVPMPVPLRVKAALDGFQADVIHSHHPFLLGDTALRAAAARNLPVVFTHHTLYERYTHYVPGDSAAMKRFVVDLVVGYCNLCDAVIAPSESVQALLAERGVTAPTTVIPTGVERERFATGDGAGLRAARAIPPEAFVVGHVGRLAAEKNLGALTDGVARFLGSRPGAHFLVAGDGPFAEAMASTLGRAGVAGRVHFVGTVTGQELVDTYHAMDVFAFASQTETQGMVLAEAMACGVPVVAVDASGVREVVRDRENGRLLATDDAEAITGALAWIEALGPDEKAGLAEGVAATAERFSMDRSARMALEVYEWLCAGHPASKEIEGSTWAKARRLLGEEWRILRNIASAFGEAGRRSEG